MQIRAEDGIRLIADLWMDSYPLVRKYFGRYLGQLLKAAQDKPFDEHFALVALRPGPLEQRLRRLESIGQIQMIVSEIGDIEAPQELDRRLMDAWAELRVIDQLLKEDFGSIQKVKVTADLTAIRGEQRYAFQVKHISKSWSDTVVRRATTERSDEPDLPVSQIAYGRIADIYRRLSPPLWKQLPEPLLMAEDKAIQLRDDYGPLSYYFWDALDKKNSKFKSWCGIDDKRCVVIVSSEEELQDPLVRHLACRLIREAIHQWLPAKPNFEELIWLPDLGNGAWFKVGSRPEDTRCFVDWHDEPGRSSEDAVNRKEVDLDSISA